MSRKNINDRNLQAGIVELEEELRKKDELNNIEFIPWDDSNLKPDQLVRLDIKEKMGKRTKQIIILKEYQTNINKPLKNLTDQEKNTREKLVKEIIEKVKDKRWIIKFEGL